MSKISVSTNSLELVCVSWELASDPACVFVLLSLLFFLPGSTCVSVLLLNFKNLGGDFRCGDLEGVLGVSYSSGLCSHEVL